MMDDSVAAKEAATVAEEKKGNVFDLEWTMEDTVMVLDAKAGDTYRNKEEMKKRLVNFVPLPQDLINMIVDYSETKTIPGNGTIVAFDMDGTWIKPKSGKVFPKGRSDWVWLFPEVPKKLKALHAEGKKVVIFTNQAGIGTGTTPAKDIRGKILDLQKELGFPFQAFAATQDDLYRKPATLMWDQIFVPRNHGVTIDKSKSYYVGDAAGRPKAWDGNPKTKKDFSAGNAITITFVSSVIICYHLLCCIL
jgi:polynucleotide 5'-kinase 3'-phosphatase